MIREDYLIGWIKRYIRWLAEIAGFIKTQDYEAAARRADLALRELLSLGADSVISLTDGEILARLAVDDPPPIVRDKCLLVAALLYHLGETAVAKGNRELGENCWLKSLQVVLGTQLHGSQTEHPEYAPKVRDLLGRLSGVALPPRTEAALVIYYEQRNEFDRAEDALFRLLDTLDPASRLGGLELGRGFYQRLRVLSDDALAAGGLTRREVEDGLRELEAWASGPADGSTHR